MPQLIQNPSSMLPTYAATGARLVSSKGDDLPLRGITLTSDAVGGIARTTLRQHFHNPYPDPLELTYSFPLPADGAVGGYMVRAGSRTIEGHIARREEAREQYDEARLTGRTAALVEQERPNLFTQQLGNIPPSTDVIVELTIDHPLLWVSGGEWEWRFPTVVAPRYLGAEGTVADHERVTVDVVDGVTHPTASVTLTIADQLQTAPTSPTHRVVVTDHEVRLAEDSAPDRDIVVRWGARRQAPGCTLRTTRPAASESAVDDFAYGLLTIVPPAIREERFPRDLVLLLDVSGSMDGKPLERLKHVVTSLIESLGDDDRLEMIAFSSSPTRYRQQPFHATATERQKACEWIRALTASGGTEMIAAIDEALRPLRQDVPRQVVIVTDGLIGFEASAVRAIRDGLPKASRLHAVGVGSASNRAFLRPAARAGRGVELVIDLDEQVVRGTERIVAATREPVVIDVTVEGSALDQNAPRLPDLLAGSPVLATVKLRPSGGTLVVRGDTASGTWEERIEVPAGASAERAAAIQALWARETIEDLELDLACGGEQKAIDQQIEQIALQYAVSSRLTSWIAIAKEPSVDPRDPVRTERIPQVLPYGMSGEGLGLYGAPLVLGRRAAPAIAVSMRHSDDHALRASNSAQRSKQRRDEIVARRDAIFAELESLNRAALDLARRREDLERRLRETIAEDERERHRGESWLEALRSVVRKPNLRGRLVPTPGRPTTTLEIVLTSALNWQPGTTAKIHGRTIDIVEAGTTRRGPIAAGSLVRVELSAAPADLSKGQVELECGDDVLVVEFVTAD